ncbi:MAG: alpha/beta fold hydrolase [Thermomicrobiales bacterium]
MTNTVDIDVTPVSPVLPVSIAHTAMIANGRERKILMHATHVIGRWVLAIALLLTTSGQIASVAASTLQQAASPVASPGATPPARIEPEHCPFAKDQVPTDLVEGKNFRCGTLKVPADHAQPGGATITLLVTVITSTNKKPSANPLFVLAGGPGQGASDQLGQFSKKVQPPIATWAPFRDTHDIVLVDQRGTGHSDPSLLCPADLTATPSPGVAVVPTAATESAQTAVSVYGDCAKALIAEGADLSTFTTAQSAADLDSVRQALGARQIDLVGTSYGTWLALEVMRNYPQTVHSEILNSPVPPQADLFLGRLLAFDESLTATFAGCEADPQCNAAYPKLDKQLSKTVAELNQNPRTVPYTDPTTGKKDDTPIDGNTFMDLVYQLDFIGPFIPLVAPLIESVANGNDDLMSQLLPILALSSEGISTGLYYSVMCQDEIPFISAREIAAAAKAANVRPEILAGSVEDDVSGTFALCREWGLPASPSIESQPVNSDVPTLIMSGKFDPIIPHSYGEELAKTLPNSTLVQSPIAGHDPLSTSGSCGVAIASSFLMNPGAKVDASCMKKLRIDFSPPAH